MITKENDIQCADEYVKKSELDNLIRESVSEVSAIFKKEIAELKQLILDQNKYILGLNEIIKTREPDKKVPADETIAANINISNKSAVRDTGTVRKNDGITNIDGNTITGFEQTTKSISGLHKNSGSLEWSVVASKRNIKKVSSKDGDPTTSGNFSDNMLDARNKVEKRLKPIVGSSQSNVLKSAPKVPLTQIHVSRLHPDTDASDVRSF
ncbi:hypothetical protein WA026_013579 [Henosepilachna vigintioctopunctata]|uniref:Uncharacterized protein n=1 Tax=Henosepilachna vigintioctopunctata TaxID=420089 RepID=A0AAW1VCP8_9CUCU